MSDWRLAGPATGDSRATWYQPALYACRSGVATKRTADAVSVLAAVIIAMRSMRVRRPRHITALRAVTAPAVRTQRRRSKVVPRQLDGARSGGALSGPASLVMLDL
jgi:hypothetical protein